jgi:di/tricarboxylate transporter
MNNSVSFGTWLLISVPFCVFCTLMIWILLIILLSPDDVPSIPIIVYERDQALLSKRNVTVMILSLVTLIIFAMFQYVSWIFGDISIVACIFVFIMFGSGILSEVR